MQTVRLLVIDPAGAFSRLRADGDLTSPMLFGIIVSWLCVLLSQLWNVVLSNTLGGALGDMDGLERLFQAPSILELVGVMLLWPVVFVVIVFIGAGILHLCLMMVGAMAKTEVGFEGTLKVYVYATVSWLALVIPFAGSFVGPLWHAVLLVIGFAKVHRTGQGRSLIAVLIPTIVCCLFILGAGVLFGAVLYKVVEELIQQGGL
ncbi:MAG: hypothetical protein BMS9Abin37_2002 [Acidobacteriota bacterium]|nr:MAG: hypothetical protein BMS9Abin37_2002 [Acidobacteriota bacterium]